MSLVCPIDNKDDAIQKVSAVVASGQSTGTFSGPSGGTVSYDGKIGSVAGHTTLSGSSTSQLAVLLAPPSQPESTSYSCLLTLLGAFFAFMGGGACLSLPFIMPMAYGSFTAPVFNNSSGTSGIFTMLCFGSSYVVIYGAMLWGAVKIFRARKNHISNEKERVMREEPNWQKAMGKWDRLYYCHKHDIVFDPENGETCAPNSLKEFLYK